MSRRRSSWLAVAASLVLLGAPMACGSWQAPRSFQIETRADRDATHRTVRQVLEQQKYQATGQNDANREITVRAHVDENSAPERQSFITVQTTPEGNIVLSPSGFLVRADGKVHRKLNNEIDSLKKAIAKNLQNPGAAASSSPSAPDSGVPTAWSEPAYDPKTWGPGDFTCLPVKIPAEDQQALRLKLSNGEEADLALSLAYAPELCRSPAQCPLPTGCPALGFGDSQQVARLAQRLVNKEVGDQAILLHHGQSVVTIDLARHGTIAKAMAQTKPSTAPDGGAQGGSWH